MDISRIHVIQDVNGLSCIYILQSQFGENVPPIPLLQICIVGFPTLYTANIPSYLHRFPTLYITNIPSYLHRFPTLYITNIPSYLHRTCAFPCLSEESHLRPSRALFSSFPRLETLTLSRMEETCKTMSPTSNITCVVPYQRGVEGACSANCDCKMQMQADILYRAESC
ncbi:hypothetical protein CDAR_485491 [Caerostris darwini]|uniref:Uncharacterized protein n=1 Tax=Caerostris darwini TaxID=1538125 RepID=A0AAV4PC61_9ARAC|nr:hypothetical protein CDAR_485491 [Caerostris darwini]